jgi:hypothetical protein
MPVEVKDKRKLFQKSKKHEVRSPTLLAARRKCVKNMQAILCDLLRWERANETVIYTIVACNIQKNSLFRREFVTAATKSH